MIGKTLVHYEITAEIGKGGMGEVYQAKDTKLGRDVAIKVLPEEFAMDSDRVARFQREAKLLASLNHPNIAAIYGLEESDGTHFLVMELIEGDTLRDRIKSGPIPVEEALGLALQMAEALEAAHEKGVIHRDLKPANIKVTPYGKVKILDFGLAKVYVGDQENLSPMDSPTISAAVTQQGVILGTAAYMSPEQAKGKSVDKRADIWAFGVILFEVLTGRQLFTGETASETLASVMKSEPEWDNLPPNLHSRIRLLLDRCLKKDPKDRYSGINDARVDIQEALADPSGVFVQPIPPLKPREKTRVGLSWAAGAVVLAVIIAALVGWNLKPSEPSHVTRFTHELTGDQQFSSSAQPVLALSPDGRKLAFNTNKGLLLRSMDESGTKLIADATEVPSNPFFSPDGQWVGFYSGADAKLKKVALSGGAAVDLCDAEAVLGVSWSEDDTIVYSEMGSGIMRVSASGGSSETLIESHDVSFYHPRILPDGKSLIFTLQTDEGYVIAVQSLKTGERNKLFMGDCAWYLPPGYLVYARNSNLYAVPYDIEGFVETGVGIKVAERVFRLLRAVTAPQFTLSNSGTLVYMPDPGSGFTVKKSTLVLLNREGKEKPLGSPPGAYSYPKISPDGTRVALTVSSGENTDIWTLGLVPNSSPSRLTFEKSEDMFPLWTLDSKQIVFTSAGEGRFDVCMRAADGTGSVEYLSSPFSNLPSLTIPSSWSSDGKILLLEVDDSAQGDIWLMSMEDEHKWQPLLQEKHSETQPQISPDGRWMAYTSNESGQHEIFVRPFPNVNEGRWQVSVGGGTNSIWSPDGQELFYRNGDLVMAVSVKTDPSFTRDTPITLFQGPPSPYTMFDDVITRTSWDVHPDGERFLMMKPDEPEEDEDIIEAPRTINIVLNWVEELKQRVPVD